MEIYKYNKYKIKYLNLKNKIKGGGSIYYLIDVTTNVKNNIELTNFQNTIRRFINKNIKCITNKCDNESSNKSLYQNLQTKNNEKMNYFLEHLTIKSNENDFFNKTKYSKYNDFNTCLNTITYKNKFQYFLLIEIQ